MQFPVSPSEGETHEKAFAKTARAALRSDPDVIMIGEIRDQVSAQTAIDAVMVGNQVWTTIKARSLIGTLKRLSDFGIPEKYLVTTDMISGLISQRLVPKLCKNCRIPWKEAISPEIKEELNGADIQLQNAFNSIKQISILMDHVNFRNPETGRDGCGEAGCHSGYQGRTAVAEVMIPSNEFLVYAEADTRPDIAAERFWLQEEGGILMREHCMMKMIAGDIDPRDMMEQVMDLQQLKMIGYDRLMFLIQTALQEGMIEMNSDLRATFGPLELVSQK